MAKRKEKKLQTDPRVVAKLADEREGENWRFQTFLQGIDLEPERLDALRAPQSSDRALIGINRTGPRSPEGVRGHFEASKVS